MFPIVTTMLIPSIATSNKTESEKENTPTINLQNMNHLLISGRTHRAKTCKLHLQTSFADTEKRFPSVLSKRTKNKRVLPSNVSQIFDRDYWEIQSPDGLSLLSCVLGIKRTRHSRQTRIELWIRGNIDDINLDFSGPKSIMLKTKLWIHNIDRQKSRNQIPDIKSVPPNFTGTIQSEDRKVITSCNRAT